jgi:hypothetical protein
MTLISLLLKALQDVFRPNGHQADPKVTPNKPPPGGFFIYGDLK